MTIDTEVLRRAMAEKCPKCAAVVEERGLDWIRFSCGSWRTVLDMLTISGECKNRQIRKLEDFVRAVKQANTGESGLDGFEKRVLTALAALEAP